MFVTAAPIETAAVLRGLGAAGAEVARWRVAWVGARCGVVQTGVGKAAAAGGAGVALAGVGDACVVNIGIGGTLGAGAALGAVVVGLRSVFADEGVATPEGFIPLARLGFPISPVTGDGVDADGALAARFAVPGALCGVIATVSTCSGTDTLRDAVIARSGAVAEAMEGAAVGLVAQGLGLPFVEVRCISNTTGDRSGQVWKMNEALAGIEAAVRSVVGAWHG